MAALSGAGQRALTAELDLDKDEAGTQGLKSPRNPWQPDAAAPAPWHLRWVRFFIGLSVRDAAAIGTSSAGVARSIIRCRSDDLPCLTTSDGAG